MTHRHILKLIAASLLLVLSVAPLFSSEPVRFEKQILTDRYYCDGINTGDINNDGKADIVAGPYWYEGPEFTTAHEFYPAALQPREASPSNSMYSFLFDFNGDNRLDILVLGRVHKHSAYWYENPGETGRLWEKHYAFERVRGESPTLIDLNGDGKPQLICHWNGKWGWIEPDWKHSEKPWKFRAIGENKDWPQFYHGTGAGDVNGDERLDLIINDGWYEQPKNSKPLWTFHPDRFSKDRGGAQMFAYDVNGDSRNDVITALHAHEWGLAWFEQTKTSGERQFQEHLIMGNRQEEKQFGVAFSQPHALDMADIDGDGLQDIIVGKRMWAHGPKGDVEPNADPVLYWFQLQQLPNGKANYFPHLIDSRSGVGVQVTARDVNSDGRVDILTASKLGAFLFLNRGRMKSKVDSR